MRLAIIYGVVAVLALTTTASAEISGDVVKIGVLNDMSGLYADLGGQGSVEAARMAIADFGGMVNDKKIELISADHQNKPDIGSAVATQWFGNDGVDAIVDVPTSSVALAVQEVARNKNKVFLISGAAASDLTGKACSPTSVHWTYDTVALANGTGAAVVKTGGDTWFFITADYAFGHALERDTAKVVEDSGGKVLGKVRAPLNTADFAPYLAQLRRDVDAYLTGLGKIRKGPKGRRARPCSPKTIKTRRAELVAVAKMALRTGIPIANLTSLPALLHPNVVEKIVDAYWNKDGDEPKIFTIELGSKLLGLARQFGLDEEAIERLADIRDNLEEHRHGGMTPKNLTLIRKVLTAGIWKGVVDLPTELMREARANLARAPVKAALTAQLAAAIAILSFAPVRLTNLVSIVLDKNLIKPGGPDAAFWLVFPHYDVKNRVNLQFELDGEVTDLINEYIHDFRPHLLRGSNSACLFPGVSGQPKTANMFSSQITERIEDATGLRVTVHQFRHAAAAIYLRHNPGDYETVRRFLGHRNIQTTINFYCGLETTQASEAFGKIIRQQVKFEQEA